MTGHRATIFMVIVAKFFPQPFLFKIVEGGGDSIEGGRMKESMKNRPLRIAKHARKTAETEISMELGLDGNGKAHLETGLPFFEHMLDHICRQGLFDLELTLRGDLGIDAHHSVEDAGIVLGNLLHEALGDKRGIVRYGSATLPMDEVLTTVAVDLGGRYHFKYTGPERIRTGRFGLYDGELTLEFLEKFAMNARMNLHVLVHYGENVHHIHESIFKALGRALRMAVAYDAARGEGIASTKGLLE